MRRIESIILAFVMTRAYIYFALGWMKNDCNIIISYHPWLAKKNWTILFDHFKRRFHHSFFLSSLHPTESFQWIIDRYVGGFISTTGWSEKRHLPILLACSRSLMLFSFAQIQVPWLAWVPKLVSANRYNTWYRSTDTRYRPTGTSLGTHSNHGTADDADNTKTETTRSQKKTKRHYGTTGIIGLALLSYCLHHDYSNDDDNNDNACNRTSCGWWFILIM